MHFNKTAVISIFALVLVFYSYSFYNRIPNIDDAWIGEQVYWLQKDGVVKNVLMSNYKDNQTRLLIFHKAFLYTGLAAVSLFGFSLWTLKSVSLVFLFLFMIVFYNYLIRLKLITNIKQFVPIFILLIIQPHIFEYSFVYRPEIMLMFSGFLSFIFFQQSIQNEKNRFVLILISSVFAGLSLLIHLNGAIFGLAAGLILLYKRRFKDLLIFTIPVLAFVYTNFSHLQSLGELQLWYQQLMAYETGTRENSSLISSVYNIFINVVNEHMRYFHSPAEIVTSLFLAVSIIFSAKSIKTKIPYLLPFMVILMIGLAIIAPTKTPKYFIPLIPFFALSIIVFVSDQLKLKSENLFLPVNTKTKVLLSTVIIFSIVSISVDTILSTKKFNSERNRLITEKYIYKSEYQKNILAPMTFIFNELGNYNEIIGLMSFNERAKTNKRITNGDFFYITSQENINFILLNDYYIKKFNIGEIEKGKPYGDYVFIDKIDDLSLFAKQNHPSLGLN